MKNENIEKIKILGEKIAVKEITTSKEEIVSALNEIHGKLHQANITKKAIAKDIKSLIDKIV